MPTFIPYNDRTILFWTVVVTGDSTVKLPGLSPITTGRSLLDGVVTGDSPVKLPGFIPYNDRDDPLLDGGVTGEISLVRLPGVTYNREKGPVRWGPMLPGPNSHLGA